MALISTDLVSPVGYTAGQGLGLNLHFEAPADTVATKLYILGALYTDTTYVSGSLFGVLKAAGVDYGVNDAACVSIWELNPEQAVDLPCRFILDRTNCLLGLFLMRMVGDIPNLDSDEQLAQISVQLAAPVPISIWEQTTPLITVVFALGMVGMMTRGMFKK